MMEFALFFLEVTFNTFIVLAFFFGVEAIFYQMGTRNSYFLTIHYLLFEKDKFYTYSVGGRCPHLPLDSMSQPINLQFHL